MDNLISYIGVFDNIKTLSSLQLLFYDELHVMNSSSFIQNPPRLSEKDIEVLKDSNILKYVTAPSLDDFQGIESEHPKLFQNYSKAISSLDHIRQQREVLYRKSVLGKRKIGLSASDDIFCDSYTVQSNVPDRKNDIKNLFSRQDKDFIRELEKADQQMVNLLGIFNDKKAKIEPDAYAVINSNEDRKIYLPVVQHDSLNPFTKFIDGYALDILKVGVPDLNIKDLISFKFDNQDKLLRLRLAINELTASHGDIKHTVNKLNLALNDYNLSVDKLKQQKRNQRMKFYFSVPVDILKLGIGSLALISNYVEFKQAKVLDPTELSGLRGSETAYLYEIQKLST